MPTDAHTLGTSEHDAKRVAPGHPCARSQAGFTIAELLIVLAIAATIMGLSVSSFGALKNAKLRAEAMRVSGALRMVYGRAAVNGLRYQVTFDLDAESFRVDCSEDNVLLPEDEDERDRDDDDPEADPFGIGVQAPTLADCSEPLLEPTTLRDGISFERILTPRHDEPVESGTETVAYFQNGFVERSVIWLRSGDENYLTLSIDPMNGRVTIHPGDLEIPDDFFEVEEDR